MEIDVILRAMTLDEKVRLLSGADHWKTYACERLGVQPIVLSDGPHGLRRQEGSADALGVNESAPATCFPSASALACSFDVDLAEKVGAAIGEEARDQGVSVVLGPGVNMKRSPLCGRNFEYFSEDPHVSGELGAALVRGVQSRGVGACVKHFAGNNQEHARMTSDSVIDERALREIYLRPFEKTVRQSDPWAVMTAYNRLNGLYCSQHPWLLQDVLRDEWGFRGVTVSDWGAMSESVASVDAGLDLCMPGPRDDHARFLRRAVETGELFEASIDASVRHLLELGQRVEAGARIPYSCDYGRHAELARRAASESAVLLENNGLLPLGTDARVAVIGAFSLLPRYQGAGSSRIHPMRLDDPWSAFLDAGFEADYAEGYDVATGETTEELLASAEEAARRNDVAVVFAGLPERYESEGFDRKLMVMPRGHRALIERVCAANPRTVVVLQGGAPMEMPWRHLPAAVLLMYLSGCMGGHATVDLLTGKANPCGKLAETWPESLERTALGRTFPDFAREVLYRESLYVGYRYFDAACVDVAYPFGFGRSYASFSYSDLRISPAEKGFDVSCFVRNDSDRAGAEVVQLYVAALTPSVFMPPQTLQAFTKVWVEPGAQVRASMHIGEEAFRFWDVSDHAWHVETGEYEVRIGASSKDIRLMQRVSLSAGQTPFSILEKSAARTLAPPSTYENPASGDFTDEAFAALYGKPLPSDSSAGAFSIDSPVSDMARTVLGRAAFKAIDAAMAKHAETMHDDMKCMMSEMAADMPLRSLAVGGVSIEVIEGLVSLLNGRYVRGAGAVVTACAKALARSRRR